MANLKLALRNLLKTPFVSCVAILSLALGIGANAATFSLLYQILLRPLPVQEPNQLVNLAAPGPKPGMQSSNDAGDTDVVFSYPMLRDLQELEELQSVFTGIAGHRSFGANLAHQGQTLDGQGMLVTGSYFPVLGLQPALGRLLGPQDDQSFGGHFVVVLSHAYWQSRFAASTEVIGETLIVNGQHMTIIGVAPQGFYSTTLGTRPEVFVPLSMHGLMVPQWNDRMVENRRAYWVYLFARREAEVSMVQAEAAINVPYRAIINDVEAPLQEGMSEATMARFTSKQISLEDGRKGQSSVHQDGRAPVLLLFAVTAVVLLIACANIANLLLARSASRTTEIAVRISLGANRLQLLKQLLVESCLLAVLGGLAGLIVARWTLGLIGSLLPGEAVSTIQFGLSPAIVTFVALISLGTGIFFGLFPALHSIRPDLVLALREGSTQPTSSRAAARFRSSLATVQIAMSMALLISAGLFAKSLLNVNQVDTGIEVDGLTLFSVSPELSSYSQDETRTLFEQLEDELAALPGVTSVTASLVPIISGSSWGSSVSVEGFEAGPDTDRNSRFNEVGPDYFKTLGIPLTAGREFTRADTLGAAKVAIVNDVFARKFNIDGDTIGRRMQIGGGDELDIEIIGLMPSTKYNRVKAETPPIFLIPYRQDEQLGFLTFYIRSQLPAEQMFPAIREVVRRLDPNLPVEELKTMSEQIRDNVFLDRMISTLTTAFAALATILAAVGLYGVLAYGVAQRTREIGLRMALGADTGRVRRMVLVRVGWMTLIGGVIGLIAAIGLGRVAQSLLFEVEAHDPMVLCYSAALLVVIALAAGLIPALRASKIDPMVALRYE
jgi:predicted permease